MRHIFFNVTSTKNVKTKQSMLVPFGRPQQIGAVLRCLNVFSYFHFHFRAIFLSARNFHMQTVWIRNDIRIAFPRVLCFITPRREFLLL